MSKEAPQTTGDPQVPVQGVTQGMGAPNVHPQVQPTTQYMQQVPLQPTGYPPQNVQAVPMQQGVYPPQNTTPYMQTAGQQPVAPMQVNGPTQPQPVYTGANQQATVGAAVVGVNIPDNKEEGETDLVQYWWLGFCLGFFLGWLAFCFLCCPQCLEVHGKRKRSFTWGVLTAAILATAIYVLVIIIVVATN